MSFKPLTCPTCGAQIQLDDSKDIGFCMYCGNKILLHEKVELVGTPSFDSLMKNFFMNVGTFCVDAATRESLNKAAEIDCENIYVIIAKMILNNPDATTNYSSIGYCNDEQYYNIVKNKYPKISQFEKNVINKNNCTRFFKCYCANLDINRVEWMLENFYSDIILYGSTLRCIYFLYEHGYDLTERFANNKNVLLFVLEALFAYNMSGGSCFSVDLFPLKFFKMVIEEKIFKGRIINTYHMNDGENTVPYKVNCDRLIYVLTDKPLYKEDIKLVGNSEEILKYMEYIRKMRDSGKFVEPKKELLPKGKDHLSRCYVATAVYGSYDCPEVWTLRRFRDNILSKCLFGRLFILLYYSISPKLVECFGDTDWFKNMWRPFLDKMVNKLNNNGIDNTPYNDRQW